jgi:hypothetical protein
MEKNIEELIDNLKNKSISLKKTIEEKGLIECIDDIERFRDNLFQAYADHREANGKISNFCHDTDMYWNFQQLSITGKLKFYPYNQDYVRYK